jgi:hypothetical protein
MLHTQLPSQFTGGARNVFRQSLASLLVSAAVAGGLLAMAPGGHAAAAPGRWAKLTNQPTFLTDTALLLTDGTVMVHEYGSATMNNWWRLTPDINGNYQNGTWSQLASMSSTYGPLYFASAVLPDGRVIVEGGEYNFLQFAETNKGAIYDPVTNVWTTVNPPAGWTSMGDSPGVVLDDGTFMLGQNSSRRQVLFNATTLTWTAVGTGKADNYSEEGFCKLPGGKILIVDCSNGTNSELFDPTNNQWLTAGSTIVKLPDASSLEIGPTMQRPDGTVVAFGGTVHNAVYTPSTGTWAATADFPGGNDMADAPGSLLPDGNVLVLASPGIFQTPSTFFVFDGTTFTQTAQTQSAHNITSYEGRLLLLPSGQVLSLVADGQTIDMEIYTSKGKPLRAWAPSITSVPSSLTRGNSYQISGRQFNGLSHGSDYGDDGTMATNYPLVRITNVATGHIFYARTHNHSTMAIATGNATVSTTFDVPAAAETGASTISVVADGIASKPQSVTLQ